MDTKAIKGVYVRVSFRFGLIMLSLNQRVDSIRHDVFQHCLGIQLLAHDRHQLDMPRELRGLVHPNYATLAGVFSCCSVRSVSTSRRDPWCWRLS